MNVFRIVDGRLVANQYVLGWTDMLVEIGAIPLKQIEHNKTAARKFIEALNEKDTVLLSEICTPEVAKEWIEIIPVA